MSEGPLNILITSVSAKMGLVKAFAELPQARRGRVIGIDGNPQATAQACCDEFYSLPPNDAPDFWSKVNAIIEKEAISLVVPTREAELLDWSHWQQRALFPNVKVAVSSPEGLEICSDKWKTDSWLRKHHLPAPLTLRKKDIQPEEIDFNTPWIAKDPLGAGSQGIKRLEIPEALAEVPDDWLLQRCLEGQEYTINTYVDRSGQVRCIIPHRRDKVVNGEVHQAETVDDAPLQKVASALLEKLPGIYGPLNFQVFWKGGDETPFITDINPRFGGGYPLCHVAGGRFTEWLVAEALGESLNSYECSWRRGLKLNRGNEPEFYE